MHDSGVLIIVMTCASDTCKVSISLEIEVSPEANDKPDVKFVAASTHSKLADDVHLCFQTRRSDAHHSLAAHTGTVMPCCYSPCQHMIDSASGACLVGMFYVTISHVNKQLKVLYLHVLLAYPM